MAATTRRTQRTLPLLRRPLPPKQSPKTPPSPSPPPTSFYEDERHENRQKTPLHSLQSCSKPKVSDRRLLYCGDVPLPDTSVVHPYHPRGPLPLPPRRPRKVRELPLEMYNSYQRPPPVFTLKNFSLRVPSRCREEDAKELVISRVISDQNYEKLTSWFAANRPKQSQMHSLEIDTAIKVPDVTPRIPPRQLSIEMRVPVAEMEATDTPAHGYSLYSKTCPVTPAVSKDTIPSRQQPLPPIENITKSTHLGITYDQFGNINDNTMAEVQCNASPSEESVSNYEDTGGKRVGHEPVVEMVADHYDDSRAHQQDDVDQEIEGVTLKSKKLKIYFKELGLKDSFDQEYPGKEQTHEELDSIMDRSPSMSREKTIKYYRLPQIVTFPESDTILPSSAPAFFQGEAIPRTSSPFASPDEYQTHISPLEAVILNALVQQSATLNIKAHFLNTLPTLVQLSEHITHVNASFNDFWVFPSEILDLKLLISLKLRNNPIREIPHGISDLKQLRVLDMSFNLLNSIPKCLFELKDLELLDLSYNRISFISSELGNLRRLRELNLEGNQLGALPASILHLNLKHLRIANNYMHPLFWKETASNQPQRLVDVCALEVSKTDQDSLRMATLPDTIKSFLKSPSTCDCCGGRLLGEGLRIIKSSDDTFGVKNLAILFLSCSQQCRKRFVKNKDAVQLWLVRNDVLSNKQQ